MVLCPAFITGRMQSQNDSSLLQRDSMVIHKGIPVVAEKKNPVSTLVVSYDIVITKSREAGIAATYNGGTKTVFADNNKASIRLVSLMRIQSIFLTRAQTGSIDKVVIVKESGKEKYRVDLSQPQWNLYNIKYNDDSIELLEDSTTILEHTCKKAILRLANGKKLTLYYTADIYNETFAAAEPSFADVPGVVLKYEYAADKSNIITYTASDISLLPVDKKVFSVPTKGYAVKKFSSKDSMTTP